MQSEKGQLMSAPRLQNIDRISPQLHFRCLKCHMTKYPENSQPRGVYALDPSTNSVLRNSRFPILDLLRCFTLEILSLQRQDSPSWLIKMLAVPKEAVNLRKQTPPVNQKWFQRMITDGATEECSYKFCMSLVIHTFPKLLSTLLQNRL